MIAPTQVRFTKNVEFAEETQNSGHTLGMAVSVGGGLIHHAVRIHNFIVVKPSTRVSVQDKVYVTSLDQLPTRDPRADPGEDGHTVAPVLYRDALGVFFIAERWEGEPAVTRRMTPEELAEVRDKARAQLRTYLENIYQAGLLLAEGREVAPL